MNDRHQTLLRDLGERVRTRREERGLSREALARSSGLSVRYLAQLEAGAGNISIARLADVAVALRTTATALLAEDSAVVAASREERVVALLGLRGAGKTTVGLALAKTLGVAFFELDQLIERAAGLSPSSVFEVHGERYFRHLERETLARFLVEHRRGVLATSGGLVTDASTYELLRRHTLTVWLKAQARDHWDRVVAQGDSRPMANRTEAMAELKALLANREPLYAKADLVVDTSALSARQTVERIAAGAVAASVR